MALDYDTYVAQISNLCVIGSTDPNFVTMLPGMIDYSEGRMYRELDLLVTRITTLTALTSGVRDIALPSSAGTYRVVERLNVITPVTASTSNGTRTPLVMTTPDFVDNIYPSGTDETGTPTFAAMTTNSDLILGPSPDAAYPLEVVGTIQPTPLSSANTTTFLTTMLPDVFLVASMVFASGYQRDFGAQSDNPQQSGSWEQQYTTLMQSANVETLRQKYQSGGWTSQIPSPIATPQRA